MEVRSLVLWLRLGLRDPQAVNGVPVRVDGFIHRGVMVR